MANFPSFLAALSLGAALSASASAQLHDEFVDGDLSSTGGAPTALVLSPGANVIKGSVVSPADRRDFITFTLTAGQQLVALNHLQHDDLDIGGSGNLGYHALHPGATSSTPSMSSANNFLGGDHLGAFTVGADILPNLAAPNLNGSGFALPLGPGTYSYVVQQTGPETIGYTVELVVSENWTDQGCELAGTAGAPLLTGVGDLSSGSLNTITLSNAAPSSQAGLFVSFSSTPVGFKGGTLKPVPFILFKLLNTSPAGTIPIPFVMPAGLPAATELWVQYGVSDAGAPVGVALSNAIRGVTP